MSHRRLLFTCAALLQLVLPPHPAGAQTAPSVNIYRYILDVDVPESAALVGLDATPSRVLRGSMPKPLSASVMHDQAGGVWRTGAGADAAPYYVLGGGVRSIEAYRAMTVQGRLMRVLTKTIISVAALPVHGSTSAHELGVGVRSTLHDPHDPVTGSRLHERVDSIVAASGAPIPDADVDLRGVSDDLAPLYATARREMRARGGDVQVAAGWGMARRIGGGEAEADVTRRTRHTLWLTGQHTRGARTDLLATVQLRDAFDDERTLRIGAGVQTKAAATDVRTEVIYDAADRRLHPGVAVESHLLPGVGAVVALSSGVRADGVDEHRLRVSMLLRWYFVSRY